MIELSHMQLESIDSLELVGNELDADAMRALVTGFLPNLASLHLSENNLDAKAAQWLSTSHWTKLEYLVLDDNLLDNVAMQHLAQGQWDLLRLCVFTNKFDNVGLEYLTRGRWPCLDRIELDVGLGNAETWRILDLVPEYLPDLHTKVKQEGFVRVPRLQQGHDKVWQGLLPRYPLEVLFCDCPTTRLASGKRQEHKYQAGDTN